MAWKPNKVDSIDMAVHAALVPGGAKGRVLFFGGYLVGDTHLYDVADEALVPMAPRGVPGYNAFCSGHAFLADGRVLVAGGQRQARDEYGEVRGCDEEPKETDHAHGGMTWGGERRCALFNPLVGSWSPAADLNLDPAGNPHSGGRWYPTLTTLPGGDVLAVGGHPFLCEDYPSAADHRHSNSTPERYHPGGDVWTLLASHPPALNQLTAENWELDYDYQRNHLLSNGRVFFASRVREMNRFYRTDQGVFLDDPVVDLPPENTYQSSNFARFTSVLLPLLHQEGYRPRVLVANGQRPYRVDLDAQDPAWETAGDRQWPDPEFPDGIGPRRYFACPVILPTGEVFFSGGTQNDGSNEVRQNNAVKKAEIYDPDVNWDAGYNDGTGSWQTLEEAEVARHYHSTALLLPDGSVWTAGSNGPSDDPAHPDGDERRIEIYEPWYFAQQGNRPDISDVPANIGYGYTRQADAHSDGAAALLDERRRRYTSFRQVPRTWTLFGPSSAPRPRPMEASPLQPMESMEKRERRSSSLTNSTTSRSQSTRVRTRDMVSSASEHTMTSSRLSALPPRATAGLRTPGLGPRIT